MYLLLLSLYWNTLRKKKSSTQPGDKEKGFYDFQGGFMKNMYFPQPEKIYDQKINGIERIWGSGSSATMNSL